THLEAFVRDHGPQAEPEVVFGELACRPPGGAIMDLMASAYGFDPWEAHLRSELGQAWSMPQTATTHAGVFVLHPEAGEVVAIESLEQARASDGVVSVECRLRVGDVVTRRMSTGESRGRILACTENRDRTAAALL